MNKMQAPELEAVIRFARAGLLALTDRVLTLVSLLGTTVMFGWVMLDPNWIRFAGACAFALLVLWPLMRHEAAKKESQ